MGATLVAQAITHWSHVSDRAFRVLIAMAVTAKDNASKEVPAGLYFGGQDQLTTALARKNGGTKASAIRTVKRAIEELIDVGAIRCTQPAVLGSRAVYKLTLNAIPMPVDNSNSRSTNIHNRGDTASPPGGDTASPPGRDTRSPHWRDSASPPCKEPLEEPLEELEKEEGVAVITNVTEVVSAADAKSPEEFPTRCPNPECLMGNVIDPSLPKGKRTVPCPQCNPIANVIPIRGRRSA